MKQRYLIPIVIVPLIFASACCSWKYNKKDFEFSKEELSHLGPYKIGDTIYFESNLGDIDTITIIDIQEERHEGSKCFIQTEPYHYKSIVIKHLPNDKWAGTNWSEEEGKKIDYQSLVAISKSPLDSIRKIAGYSVTFKGFTTEENALKSAPEEFTINSKSISNCYKITHGYPERVTNPDDIEIVYWTDKYGLTAYTSKSGETWLIKK